MVELDTWHVPNKVMGVSLLESQGSEQVPEMQPSLKTLNPLFLVLSSSRPLAQETMESTPCYAMSCCDGHDPVLFQLREMRNENMLGLGLVVVLVLASAAEASRRTCVAPHRKSSSIKAGYTV
jgi:hypothetical protein